MRAFIIASAVLALPCRAADALDAGVLNVSLADRITAGECAGAAVESGGTFFPLGNQTSKEEAHARFFDILYASTFKVVVSELAGELYVLTQCGLDHPSEKSVEILAREASLEAAANYTRKYFHVPLRSYAAASTVHNGFLNQLGVAGRAGHVSQWATEPCWQRAVDCGANANDKDAFEALFTSVLEGSPGASSSRHIFVPAVQDPAPMNSAEYLKFFGVFFNKDVPASGLFREVREAYSAAGSGHSEQPVVAWISYDAGLFAGFPESFKVSEAAYKVLMVSDAGGGYFNASAALHNLPGLRVEESVSGRSFHIDVSAYSDRSQAARSFTDALAGADVVIDETYAAQPATYDLDAFLQTYELSNASSLGFVENSMVLRFDGTISSTGGLDWYESRIARPDWAVNGLVRCLHRDNTKQFKYFRNIAVGESPQVLDAGMCAQKLPLCGDGAPEALPLLGYGRVPGGTDNGGMLLYVAVPVVGMLALGALVATKAPRGVVAGEDPEAGQAQEMSAVPLQDQHDPLSSGGAKTS